MPVKDALPFLDVAISSILVQTFADFELVIGDDGSTDGSSERLRGWAARDSRIRLMHRHQSSGPVGSSNWVANAGTSPLVARMDADDIAHPDRLRRQVELLDARPDVALVGTLFEAIDSQGRLTRRSVAMRAIDSHAPPPIPHGSIMYRKEIFDRVGGYAAGTDYFEDIDLYYRIVEAGTLTILMEPLYRYRFSTTSARLNIPVGRLQQAFNLQRVRRNSDYHPADTRAASQTPRADTLRAVGSLRLWSGNRPGIVGDLFRHRALGLDLPSVRVLAWALWGAVSPGSLRASMRLASRVRAAATRRQMGDVSLIEWRPVRGQRRATVKATVDIDPALADALPHA